jgi:hypothetical protein
MYDPGPIIICIKIDTVYRLLMQQFYPIRFIARHADVYKQNMPVIPVAETDRVFLPVNMGERIYSDQIY